MMRRAKACVCALVVPTAIMTMVRGSLAQDQTAPQAERIALSDAVVINRVGPPGAGRRAPVSIDVVQHLIVTGQWKTPKPGDSVTLPDGSTRAWTEARAGDDGVLNVEEMRGGYALFVVESASERVMLLNARGHGMVYVNGEPRCGDLYDNGIVSLPVKLRAGVNEFLFHCPRGGIRAELAEPRAKWVLSAHDMTLPDMVSTPGVRHWGAAVVINATERPAHPRFRIVHNDAVERQLDVINQSGIPPLSVRKVGFVLPEGMKKPLAGVASLRLQLEMLHGASRVDDAPMALILQDDSLLQRRTFVSEIDGSVQYFALRPARKDDPGNGLILTLHGASVEGQGQAAAYTSKDWANIVAPTNRRPFGFDWEDWGRLDALEVLDIARQQLPHDPERIYLTGHSMGGHGTWHIGVTFPGTFAAIAPSAGWISFESYAGGATTQTSDDDAIHMIMSRAGNASRTLELQHNLDGVGVYILHGENDDNVPVQQARTMREQLAKWHSDFAYCERPGAGHWWGNECVDWPPLIQFLRDHARPQAKDINHVTFTTASPGVSASRDWVTIEQQEKSMEFSRIDLRRDLAKRTIAGITENVARVSLDVGAFEGDAPLSVEMDVQRLDGLAKPQAVDGRIALVRDGDEWKAADAAIDARLKNPARCGPFKSAFNHRVMFVYGTTGNAEENAWAFAKARFDAETFWYRGNGSIDVIADVEFDARDAKKRDRSVTLYGNADTNSAWEALLDDSPVQIKRGSVMIGGRAFLSDDLACLFIRPRPDSDIASVGVVSGTGVIGMHLTDRLPYFISGVAYPDCTVIRADALREGNQGIEVAGFFGNDWSVETGDFAWRDR